MSESQRPTSVIILALGALLLLVPTSVSLMLVDDSPVHWLALCAMLAAAIAVVQSILKRDRVMRYWTLGWVMFAMVHAVLLAIGTTVRATTLDRLVWYIVLALVATVATLWLSRESSLALVPFGLAAAQYIIFRDFPQRMWSPLYPLGLVIVIGITYRVTRGFQAVRDAVFLVSGMGFLLLVALAWQTITNYLIFWYYLPSLLILTLLPDTRALLQESKRPPRENLAKAHFIGAMVVGCLTLWDKVTRAIGVVLIVTAAALSSIHIWDASRSSDSVQVQLPDARRAVIDTDASYDDLIAIRYLVVHSNVNVVGITTVAGAVGAEDGANTIRRLLAVAGRGDIPVVAGAELPLSGQRQSPKMWREVGALGLLVGLPDVDTSQDAEITAKELLRTAVSDDPTTVVLAFGPLTNVASAFNTQSARVVFSGGLLTEEKEIEGDTDWNVWLDPEATRIVFEESQLDITVIPTDVTHQVVISPAAIKNVRSGSRPDSRLLGNMLAAINFGYGRSMPAWDAIVAVVFVEPEVCIQWQTMNIAVQRGGKESGYLLQTDHGRSMDVCMLVDDDQANLSLTQTTE